jgi:DNA-binding MarR family transcriptional regulator
MGLPVELSKIASPEMGNLPFAHHADALRDRLGSALRIVNQLAPAPAARPANQPVTEQDVRILLGHRRDRDRFFSAGLFADPAWDILLELYAAELGQWKIAVSSLAVAAAVPTTTALRWLATLEQAGLIERRRDPLDARRYFMSLSHQGLEAMSAYFRTVPAGAPLV